MDNQKNTPRDVALHLAGALLLYVSVGSIFSLVFQYINILFPDVSSYRNGGAIQFALASLIVVFPVYVWVMRTLYQDRKKNPEKGELPMRKWLAYLTLFLAAALIIGDFVTLIFKFLDGELSVRFLLKVVALLIVSGGVFGYYMYDIRRTAREYSRNAKLFVWCTIVAVAAVIVAGFILGGSPIERRKIRLDTQRVGNLQTIQYQIVNYWNQKDELPDALEDLRDDISGFVRPTDPETSASYEYRRLDDLSFELCAEFSQASNNELLRGPAPYGYPNENWNHEAGRVCFSRTIDPELNSMPKLVR